MSKAIDGGKSWLGKDTSAHRKTSDVAKRWLEKNASDQQRLLREAIEVADLVAQVWKILAHKDTENATAISADIDGIRFSESHQRLLPAALREIASTMSMSSWPQQANGADQPIAGSGDTFQQLTENLQHKAQTAADRSAEEFRLAAFVVDLLTSDSAWDSEEAARARPSLNVLAPAHNRRLASNAIRLAAHAIEVAHR